MAMHSLAPLPYSLEDTSPVPWNESAEGQLHRDYPFLHQDSSDQELVIRRYLETLWLPESFSPLSYLIYSLRRFSFQNSDENSIPHPLHSLLEPILLSTRAASDKFRTELVQILTDGGGAGEQEEMMMWYAWEYEKTENSEGGTINEEKWRKAWLERLERREVMIQILLLMLKLSIPSTQLSLTGRKGKKKKSKKQDPPETIEDRLESYMDKLAVWQLTGTLESIQSTSQSVSLNNPKAKEDRHWTQIFYEDTVAPLFKTELPEQCELLRSKLFPEQIVSDADESEAESLLNGRASRAGSRAPSVPRVPHTRAPSMSRLTGPQLQRSRSRSLSVSLAQDEASQRACIVAPKQSLSREVSMSRVFKEKPKAVGRLMSYNDAQKQEPLEKPRIKRDVVMTLVQETPVKRRHSQTPGNGEAAWDTWCRQPESRLAVPSPPATSSSEPGDVCIEDTPVATRVRQVDEVAIDVPSPLTPLPDDAPSTMNSAADNAKTRGRKASALKDSLASSRKPRRQLYRSPTVMRKRGHDEHSDESFIDAFKLSKVSLLEGDDNHPMLVSPSPATRTRKGGWSELGDGMKGAGLFGKSAEDMGMTAPTKRRKRWQ
ncbi:hypothetical protein ACEPAH_4232 [Sanghuangporus vaninii]